MPTALFFSLLCCEMFDIYCVYTFRMDDQQKQRKQNKKEQESTKLVKKTFKPKQLEEIRVRVTGNIGNMKNYKRSACYYDYEVKDMNARYAKDKKQFLMMQKKDPDGWSNVSSSALFKTTQAVLGEFSDIDIKDKLFPVNMKDVFKVKVWERLLDVIAKKNNFKHIDDQIFQEMVIKGVCCELITWRKVVRKVKVVKDNVKEMTDEEKQRLILNKELAYEWKDFIEYNDVDKEIVQAENIYVEPGTYRIHSRDKGSNAIAIVDEITYEDMLAEAKSDPFVIQKQVDKVTELRDNDMPTNPLDGQDVDDNHSKSKVKRSRYYNKENDEHILLYDDIPVKIVELPFHTIPVIDYHFMEFGQEFYTPGLSALLEHVMREETDIRNALLNQIKLDVNPSTFVDTSVFEEFVNAGERKKPGEIIGIPGLGSNANLIQEQRPKSNSASEAFNMLAALDTTVVEISGINPRKYGSLQKSSSATEASIVDAGSAKVIRMWINNFFKGRAVSNKLIMKWIAQEYTKPVVMNVYGEEVPETTRKILLKGVRLEYPKDDDDKLVEEHIGEAYSEFELVADKLKMEEDPEFGIAPETQQKLNEAITRQLWQNLLPQLMTVAGDPGMSLPGQPKPVINITELYRQYLGVFNISDKLLIDTEIDEKKDKENAYDENDKIINTEEYIIGQPGRSIAHISAHNNAIMLLDMFIYKLEQKMAPNPELIAQMQQVGMPIEDNGFRQQENVELEQLKDRLDYLMWHTSIDAMSKGAPIPLYSQRGQAPGQQTMPSGPQGPEGMPNPSMGSAPTMPGSPSPMPTQLDMSSMMPVEAM